MKALQFLIHVTYKRYSRGNFYGNERPSMIEIFGITDNALTMLSLIIKAAFVIFAL